LSRFKGGRLCGNKEREATRNVSLPASFIFSSKLGVRKAPGGGSVDYGRGEHVGGGGGGGGTIRKDRQKNTAPLYFRDIGRRGGDFREGSNADG